MPLDPQAETLLAQINALQAPPLREMGPELARQSYDALAALNEGGQPVASVTDRAVPGKGCEVPVRIYDPGGDGARPAVAYFHGGGFVIGGIHTHDVTCRDLANGSGAVVVSADYRRCPEVGAVEAIEDGYAVATWVHEHAADLGVDPSLLAVAGDSAGGNVAASVALRARDRGAPPLALQVLVYPWLDLALTSPSVDENGEGKLLTAADLDWFAEQAVGPDGNRQDPAVSPYYAEDLAGLPPALVITAEHDPLRDEGEDYARRLRAAGVPTQLSRYDGTIHGFLSFKGILDTATKASDEICRVLRDELTG